MYEEFGIDGAHWWNVIVESISTGEYHCLPTAQYVAECCLSSLSYHYKIFMMEKQQTCPGCILELVYT